MVAYQLQHPCRTLGRGGDTRAKRRDFVIKEPSMRCPEWVETVDNDERFLPVIQGEASQICQNLWLGSEENVRDLVWLKVTKITRIVSIMPSAVDLTDSGHLSEALKLWFAQNVETLLLVALDTPTQLVGDFVSKSKK